MAIITLSCLYGEVCRRQPAGLSEQVIFLPTRTLA